MPRRQRITKRTILPDPIYGNTGVAKFVNCLMLSGKKSIAERNVYDSFEKIRRSSRREPLDVFETAMRNVTPVLEVKPKRVGGATYQVPVEVRTDRSQALAIRWLIDSARKRSENTMVDRLSAELLDAANNRGSAVKKREDTHRMAEANRAFSHYRW